MDARLALIILAVDDLRSATRFYGDAFGWDPVVSTPVYVEYTLTNIRVGLYDRRGFGRNVGMTPERARGLTTCELYLYVGDLEAAIARVERAGGRPLAPLAPRDWGDVVAYLADPDGNVIALAQPLS
jgi:predicted enzyme related to lactoylglutathione lyase